jgi:hypothetical protein
MQPKAIAPGFEATGHGYLGAAYRTSRLPCEFEIKASNSSVAPAVTRCILTLSIPGNRYAITHDVTLSSREI